MEIVNPDDDEWVVKTEQNNELLKQQPENVPLTYKGLKFRDKYENFKLIDKNLTLKFNWGGLLNRFGWFHLFLDQIQNLPSKEFMNELAEYIDNNEILNKLTPEELKWIKEIEKLIIIRQINNFDKNNNFNVSNIENEKDIIKNIVNGLIEYREKEVIFNFYYEKLEEACTIYRNSNF